VSRGGFGIHPKISTSEARAHIDPLVRLAEQRGEEEPESRSDPAAGRPFVRLADQGAEEPKRLDAGIDRRRVVHNGTTLRHPTRDSRGRGFSPLAPPRSVR
jgi:hypothetical protein